MHKNLFLISSFFLHQRGLLYRRDRLLRVGKITNCCNCTVYIGESKWKFNFYLWIWKKPLIYPPLNFFPDYKKCSKLFIDRSLYEWFPNFKASNSTFCNFKNVGPTKKLLVIIADAAAHKNSRYLPKPL